MAPTVATAAARLVVTKIDDAVGQLQRQISQAVQKAGGVVDDTFRLEPVAGETIETLGKDVVQESGEAAGRRILHEESGTVETIQDSLDVKEEVQTVVADEVKAGIESGKKTAKEIISDRVQGLDLEAHPTSNKQLSSSKMKELKIKIDSRTATREEYNLYEWNKKISQRRSEGVKDFWNQERERIISGEGTTRNWSQEQIADILGYDLFSSVLLLTKCDTISYHDYILDIVASDDDVAYLVKKADMKDHLTQVDTLSDKLKEKYLPEIHYFI